MGGGGGGWGGRVPVPDLLAARLLQPSITTLLIAPDPRQVSGAGVNNINSPALKHLPADVSPLAEERPAQSQTSHFALAANGAVFFPDAPGSVCC